MRARVVVAALLSLIVAVIGPIPWVSADDAHDDPPSTITTLPGAVGIGDGLSFTAAIITTPGEPEQRTFNAYQAAVFVQSWMAAAFYGGPSSLQDPPPDLPVSRIDVTGTWGGPTGTMAVYYASDGTKAWVSWPQAQTPSSPPIHPPPPSDWFVPPARVIEAFAGTAELIETIGTYTATSTTESAAPNEGTSAASSSADSMPWGTVGLVAAAVAVMVVLGGLLLRHRRA